MMNIADTAHHFGVSTRTVRNWIKAGCPAVQRGIQIWRLDPAAVSAWLETQRETRRA